MKYNPNKLTLSIAGKEITGFYSDKPIKIKRPWRVVIDLPISHEHFINGATRLECITKQGQKIAFNLLNDSDSLKEIFSHDPYGENKLNIKLR